MLNQVCQCLWDAEPQGDPMRPTALLLPALRLGSAPCSVRLSESYTVDNGCATRSSPRHATWSSSTQTPDPRVFGRGRLLMILYLRRRERYHVPNAIAGGAEAMLHRNG